ncbi:MAG: hypothetical protein OEY41_16805 [Acidimicrobiia bacterium]|nr:hypothetical protein [Acidimicrobiia bacterium]MDH5291656.1 hypothetical protein [Acidimicrobiia bacterium]
MPVPFRSAAVHRWAEVTPPASRRGKSTPRRLDVELGGTAPDITAPDVSVPDVSVEGPDVSIGS